MKKEKEFDEKGKEKNKIERMKKKKRMVMKIEIIILEKIIKNNIVMEI